MKLISKIKVVVCVCAHAHVCIYIERNGASLTKQLMNPGEKTQEYLLSGFVILTFLGS